MAKSNQKIQKDQTTIFRGIENGSYIISEDALPLEIKNTQEAEKIIKETGKEYKLTLEQIVEPDRKGKAYLVRLASIYRLKSELKFDSLYIGTFFKGELRADSMKKVKAKSGIDQGLSYSAIINSLRLVADAIDELKEGLHPREKLVDIVGLIQITTGPKDSPVEITALTTDFGLPKRPKKGTLTKDAIKFLSKKEGWEVVKQYGLEPIFTAVGKLTGVSSNRLYVIAPENAYHEHHVMLIALIRKYHRSFPPEQFLKLFVTEDESLVPYTSEEISKMIAEHTTLKETFLLNVEEPEKKRYRNYRDTFDKAVALIG